MGRSSFLAAFFIVITSVLLFSGQARRPYTPPQQTPQRQAIPQTAPPKPATTVPAPPAVPVAEKPNATMPPLFWLPEDIKFPETQPGASRTITLFGDPKTEGLYVTRTLIPKGVQTMPHTHSDSRTVTVISGVCYYGRGEEFEENRVLPMPPGSFFTEPAGTPHYIWAKDGDVIVQTTAIGPSGTQLVPVKNNTTAHQ